MFLVRKTILVWTKDKPFRMKRGYILPYTITRCFLLVMTDKTENGVGHSKIWDPEEDVKLILILQLNNKRRKNTTPFSSLDTMKTFSSKVAQQGRACHNFVIVKKPSEEEQQP